jgi:hypothetical protein
VVDPISVTLLMGAITSVAAGAGGEAGKQAWSSLVALVHKTFRRGSPPNESLAALEIAPGDQDQGAALATALVDRAANDKDLAVDLRAWFSNAQRCLHVSGDQTTNIIEGKAKIYGPVLQGRNFTGPIRFDAPPISDRPD